MPRTCWCCKATGHCFCSACNDCGGCMSHQVAKVERRERLLNQDGETVIREWRHVCDPKDAQTG